MVQLEDLRNRERAAMAADLDEEEEDGSESESGIGDTQNDSDVLEDDSKLTTSKLPQLTIVIAQKSFIFRVISDATT